MSDWKYRIEIAKGDLDEMLKAVGMPTEAGSLVGRYFTVEETEESGETLFYRDCEVASVLPKPLTD